MWSHHRVGQILHQIKVRKQKSYLSHIWMLWLNVHSNQDGLSFDLLSLSGVLCGTDADHLVLQEWVKLSSVRFYLCRRTLIHIILPGKKKNTSLTLGFEVESLGPRNRARWCLLYKKKQGKWRLTLKEAGLVNVWQGSVFLCIGERGLLVWDAAWDL